MKPAECGSELIIRQRRGTCSPLEREEARKHWATCQSCQLNHLLGSDFEDEARLEAGDDERIRRYAELAAATAGAATPRLIAKVGLRRLPRSVVYAAAAAVLLCTGVAVAQLWSRWRSPPVAARPAPVLAGKGSALTEHAEARAPAVPPEAAVRAQPPTLGNSSTGAAAAAPELRPSVLAESSASLFAKANDARRAGDTTAARALYRQLQAAFPSSPESRLSRVSLGRLLLEGGSPAGALEQFEAYLNVAGGELRLEALYGRAVALGKLGRLSDEERAWQRLLEAYPGSVYAGQAKKRLSELR